MKSTSTTPTALLSSALTVCTLLFYPSICAHADTIGLYIGTYTKGENPSEGIYWSTLDGEQGKLSAPVLAAQAVNPSFLEIHPNAHTLYAVGEGGKGDGLTAYKIEDGGSVLRKLNSGPSGGKGPCHVSLDHGGRCVLVANYSGGTVSATPLRADGSLGDPGSVIQHTGSSIHEKRQRKPHAHSVNVSPDDRFAYVADLGTDKLMIYRLDPEKGTLTPATPPSVALTPGSGPRHFTFHPTGKFAYVINELAATVTAFSQESTTGALTEIETVPTLPENFDGRRSCAEVRVHPNGKFLYASNRGHDSIAVFAIDPESGRLRFVEHEQEGIATPRNFNLDPTGRFCLVANQSGGSVIVFKIDSQSGALTPTGHQIAVQMPVCIRFYAPGISSSKNKSD